MLIEYLKYVLFTYQRETVIRFEYRNYLNE